MKRRWGRFTPARFDGVGPVRVGDGWVLTPGQKPQNLTMARNADTVRGGSDGLDLLFQGTPVRSPRPAIKTEAIYRAPELGFEARPAGTHGGSINTREDNTG